MPKIIESTCSNFQNLRLVLDTTRRNSVAGDAFPAKCKEIRVWPLRPAIRQFADYCHFGMDYVCGAFKVMVFPVCKTVKIHKFFFIKKKNIFCHCS